MATNSVEHGEERADQWGDRYRAVVENANDGIYMVDSEGKIASPNRALAEMYGYSVEEMEGMPVLDLHFPEDLSRAREALRRVERGERVFEEFSTRRKDGTRVWVEIKPVQVEAADRKLVFSITRDVTERVLAREELRASEEKYRDLVENAFDMINSVDSEGNVVEANRKMADLLGFSRAEMTRLNILDFVAPEHQDAVLEHIAMTGREGSGPGLHCDWITRDGRRVPVEINSTARYSASGTFLVTRCIVRDISERRRLEEQFLQAQKMESVGRLAGGIAHDFNNLLTAIIGYAQIGIAETPPTGRMRTYLREINGAAERASELTGQLLAFSRKQIINPAVIDLNDLVLDMEKLLGRLIGEDIELTVAPASAKALAMADPRQMEQVLMNLVVNAQDAMPAGGRLTVETVHTTLQGPIPGESREAAGGPYVVLSVGDTGVGMTEDVKDRVFEPFFTTKGPGQGSGLGLSTCYGIVAQSGGHIEVESELGVGSTFRVFLPRAEGEAAVMPAAPESADLPTGAETILLVEDDPGVRQMAALVLREKGYTVLEAPNGEEAVQVAHHHAESKISLLLTDVVMPLMGAAEIVQRLQSGRPDLKVLYMSGYTDEAIARHGVLRPDTWLLQKPFTPEMLTRRVRDVLDD